MEGGPLYIDLKTPFNASLTGFYMRSFAYQTLKFRSPELLGQIRDTLSSRKEDIVREKGEDSMEEVDLVLSAIDTLKSEIEANKPLRKLVGNAPDVELYNKYLDHCCIKLTQPTYYIIPWIFAECYMYRRIQEALDETKFLKNLDPFRTQKENAFERTFQLMAATGGVFLSILYKEEDMKEDFEKLMKLNLWSNKCDLAFKCGHFQSDPEELTNHNRLNSYILSDDLPYIWDALTDDTDSKIVDIVLDNIGYDLFTDMCLADFLIKHKYAEQIRFYVKAMPWFVSNVTANDFQWTLQQLKTSMNSNLKKLGIRWNFYMRVKIWTVEVHNFWTLPVSYKDMCTWDLQLYTKLSCAKLIIFKGDVNYRKLVGEKNWPSTMIFEDALQGFHPSKVCVLRILKADLICGLPNSLAEDIEEKDKDWLTNGNYGIIQFSGRIGIVPE